jgi:hypothetical protein
MPGLLAFAGCTINDPVQELVRRGRAADPFRQAGFAEPLFALSPAGMEQLVDVLAGRDPVPRTLWPYAYAGAWRKPEPVAAPGAILIEISTLTEFRMDGAVLNANVVSDELAARVANLSGMDVKAVRAWKNALGKCRDDLRAEAAAAILARCPDCGEREVIAGVRTEPAPLESVERSIARVRDAFPGTPLGLSLHRYQYMSGARAIDWPPELNREVRAVAARLGLPLFDGAALVARHGNETALAPDAKSWAKPFLPVVADALSEFVHSFAGVADAV